MEFQVRLLDDAPVDTDAFSHGDTVGPHQRVAEAIASLIRTESGGKAIGLEGDWGSGKSTVVRILQKAIVEDSNSELILFDAWAHAGDPLRRTFLESLISPLMARKWLSEAIWKKQLDAIANRLKITSSDTIPQPTKLGQAFAVALLIAPIGVVVLRSSLSSKTITIDPKLPFAVDFVFGLVLSLLPLVIWLISHLIAKLKPETVHAGALLLNQTISRVVTETTEFPNPTSIEFEDIFVRAMRESLIDASRQIVIVLDNLDRVDTDDARQIWATMQTFLRGRFQYEECMHRVWVVIPYDPTGVSKRFARPVNENSQNDDSAATFLDKCLQVRFSVPPLVLSDWKSYFNQLLKLALPFYSNGDCHAVYRVLDRLRAAGKPPTPRFLKLFVNQLGAIHRQWGATIPPAHVAYYVLRINGKHDALQLIAKKPPIDHLAVLQCDADSITSSLAGLFFNIDPAKGLELLLTQPILDALTRGDAQQLIEIHTNHAGGFWPVAELVVDTQLEKTPLNIATVATALRDSRLLETAEHPEVTSIQAALKSNGSEVEQWLPCTRDVAQGIIALSAVVGEEAFSKQLVKAWQATISDPRWDVSQSEPRSEVVRATFDLIQGIPDSLFDAKFTIRSSVQNWIDTCVEIRSLDPQGTLWNRFLPSDSFQVVVRELQEAAEGARYESRASDAVVVTAACVPADSVAVWKPLVKAIRERIAGSEEIAVGEFGPLFDSLCVLLHLDARGAKESRTELVNSGRITHYCHRARSEGNAIAQAAAIYLYLSELPHARKSEAVAPDANKGYASFTDALNDRAPELSTALVNLLIRCDQLQLLWSVLQAREKTDPLIDECLRLVVTRPDRTEFFDCENLLRNWRAMVSSGSKDEGDSLLAHVIRSCEMCLEVSDHIVKNESTFKREEAMLYDLLLDCADASDLSRFAQWCASGLARLDSSDWISDLSSSCECIALLLRLHLGSTEVPVNTHFSDAIEEHAKHAMRGEWEPSPELRDKWSHVLSAMANAAIRRALQGRILTSLQSLDGDIHPLFFELYGGELVGSSALKDDLMTVQRVFSPLYRQENAIGIHWVCDVLEANRSFLDTHSASDSVAEFRQRIHDYPLPEEMSELYTRLVGLAE